MPRTLVVLLWLVATVGVTYVANAAVELVDLQVFPDGSRIEVLSLPKTTEMPMPTTPPTPPTTTVVAATTVVATATAESALVPTTTESAPVSVSTSTTTMPTSTTQIVETVTTTSSTTSTTTTIPPTTTTTDDVGETLTEPAPTTTRAPVTTAAPTTTTTTPPAPTTTQAPASTTTSPPVRPVEVLTDSLPQARIGDDYRVELTAAGGVPPYTWSLSQGFLPAGLDVSAGGILSGVPAEKADALLVFQVSDEAGQLANSSEFVFATAPDRRTVVARGGTVFIDNEGDSVELFLVSPADGYSALIVEPGGFRVEVQFVPLQGNQTSWVVCEVNEGVVCTSG